LAQQGARLLQNWLPNGRNDNSGRISFKQYQPKFSLKRLDAPTERWLRYVQPRGGGCKRALVGNTDGVTPLVQFHLEDMQ